MCATAAKIALQGCHDIGIAWIRIGAQQGFCGHDDAVDAIAALRSLHLDEGLLQAPRRLVIAQAFDRRHLMADN